MAGTGTSSQMARALANPTLQQASRGFTAPRAPTAPPPRPGASGTSGTLAQMQRALNAPRQSSGGSGLPAYQPGLVGKGNKPKAKAPGLFEQAKRMALGFPAGLLE